MLKRGLLLTTALALAACGSDGGGSSAGDQSSTGVAVVPTPAPMPAPAPSPTPAPTPSPAPSPISAPPGQALTCTVGDSVYNASSLRVTPVGGNVLVVAIGSSSTAGVGASSTAASFPSVMQTALSQHPDIASYQVINAGVGGDQLPQTQARLQRDALDKKPQVVILQAGTNDAVNDPNSANLADFTARLRATVQTAKAVAPVVLMNNQHYPSEPASYVGYVAAIQQIATEQNVALFDRYALMKSWIDSGRYRYSDVLASDNFHPNDSTYNCMGQVMAALVLQSTVR